MTKHYWVLEVLRDIEVYAKINELVELEDAVAGTLSILSENPALMRSFQQEGEVINPSFSSPTQEAALRNQLNANLLVDPMK